MKTGYSFNAKYVKGITKTKFLKEFGPVYPKLDLSSIYDKIVGRKAKVMQLEVSGDAE